MTTLTDIGTLITETPGVCGGRPHLASAGVSVRRIAGWYKLGRTPEEIADQYGHLSLAQVYADALAACCPAAPLSHESDRAVRAVPGEPMPPACRAAAPRLY